MSGLTHLNEAGAAHVVDVSAKSPTLREAVAEGRIIMARQAVAAIREQAVIKGDVLAVARIASIMAAKNTAQMIPLCHPLHLSAVEVDLRLEDNGVLVRATARTCDVTGVEMEALTAVSLALLTIYDMTKAIDRGMRIEGISLVSKSGGRTGRWVARDEDRH